MALGKAAGLFAAQPRTPSTKGWFSTYDGNVVGGLLQGTGMALTGACPGTVLVQVATGSRSGCFTVAGGLFGGLAHRVLETTLSRPSKSPAPAARAPKSVPTATLASLFHLSVPSTAAIGLLAGGATISVLPAHSIVPPALLGPIQAGFIIGLSQLLSILLRRKTLGVSTAYEDIWHVPSRGASDSVYFAVGLTAGAFALSRLRPVPAASASASIGSAEAFIGGALMIFGARLAGGCTSGHGLSGVPTLGLASMITTACLFVGGIPVALAFR